MSYKKPQPLIRGRRRDPCPVCGEVSYSLTGIHPQCAARQADARRLERVKRNKKVKVAQKPTIQIKVWQKRCPKCRAVQHVRKKVCDCGHTFAHRAAPRESEGELT